MPDFPPDVQLVPELAGFVEQVPELLHEPTMQVPALQSLLLVQSTHCVPEHFSEELQRLGHGLPQPSSPHSLPEHCGVH